ncbi:hypothetical protein EV182_000364 [Spiromyces aspiralis]|uniref:Uncharacterized protein n=1 Tax=Spiromyces aspiralis TaxID=68401 RepID=A0ACC1HKM3_9FUNG|nr:hypothetical protein EV182_000364 [Spiromyces aspiralis]
MYSNIDNPFNDAALSKQFVWKKKIEQDLKQGISKKEQERIKRERQVENMRELEKLNKRREERELEQKFREQEMARLQREAEQAQLGNWEDREERFHLKQAKKRAELRIKNGRAKPVDIMAMNLRLANEETEGDDSETNLDLEVDVDEPWKILDDLSLDEVNELYHDIQMYLSLEKNDLNVEFWKSMLIVCDARRAELEQASRTSNGVPETISEEITAMLRDKDYDELLALQSKIQSKLSSGEPVDVEYWEQALKQLVIKLAKTKLSKLHEKILLARLEKLRRLQGQTQPRQQQLPGEESLQPQEEGTASEARRLLKERQQQLQARLIEQASARNASIDPSVDDSKESLQMYRHEASKEMDMNEAIFAVEAQLSKTTYSWEDKYRPRKPRYFNRVHTGYDWNKYNQTHYDHDNPPPKVVQGYKFNLFYPDLIDKSVAPTYRIEKDPENDETVIIRFIAGPPYEDVAFRIVNRPWEYSRKRGFRNSFDRGVLQLHFRFKRQFYRR